MSEETPMTEERLAYATKAFAWLLDNYDVAEHVQGLRVDQLPDLIDAVEATIVETVKTYGALSKELGQ